MSFFARFLGVLLIASVSLPAHARTWTDTQGRTIEAEFVKASGPTVTIRRTDGLVFDLPLTGLSPADRDYLARQQTSAAPSTPGKLSHEEFNTLLGLDLLADDDLWDDTPADVATRLHLPREGKTPHFEGYRAYPSDTCSVLGTRAYMISLQAVDGRITALTVMFANRGDYPAFRDRDSLLSAPRRPI